METAFCYPQQAPSRTLEAITPEKIADASLLELAKAFGILKKAELAIKPPKLKEGLESYLIQLKRVEAETVNHSNEESKPEKERAMIRKNEQIYDWVIDQVIGIIDNPDNDYFPLESIAKNVQEGTEKKFEEEVDFDTVLATTRFFDLMKKLPGRINWRYGAYSQLEHHYKRYWPESDLVLLQKMYVAPRIADRIEEVALRNSLNQLKDIRKYLQYRMKQGLGLSSTLVKEFLTQTRGLQKLLTDLSGKLKRAA